MVDITADAAADEDETETHRVLPKPRPRPLDEAHDRKVEGGLKWASRAPNMVEVMHARMACPWVTLARTRVDAVASSVGMDAR
jgi:hypothetical protein